MMVSNQWKQRQFNTMPFDRGQSSINTLQWAGGHRHHLHQHEKRQITAADSLWRRHKQTSGITSDKHDGSDDSIQFKFDYFCWLVPEILWQWQWRQWRQEWLFLLYLRSLEWARFLCPVNGNEFSIGVYQYWWPLVQVWLMEPNIWQKEYYECLTGSRR